MKKLTYRKMIAYRTGEIFNIKPSLCRINKITTRELIRENNKFTLENADLKAKNIVLQIKLNAAMETIQKYTEENKKFKEDIDRFIPQQYRS